MLYGISAYLLLTAIAVPVFILGWMRQEKTKDAGIVDVLWTLFTGWGGVAIIAFGPGDFQQRLPVLLMVSLWCIRVSHYVLQRMRDDGHEDGRYLMLREKWGKPRAETLLWLFPITGRLCADVYYSLCIYRRCAVEYDAVVDWFYRLAGGQHLSDAGRPPAGGLATQPGQ